MMKKNIQHLTDDQLMDLADAFVTEDEKQQYFDHLSLCEDCQARYQTFISINEQLASMPLLQPSVVFTERVLDQWDEIRLAVPNVKKRVRLTPFVFLGFMSFLVLVSIILLSIFSTSSANTVPVVTTTHMVRNVIGTGILWEILLVVNAVLLLWLFNQRVLAPFFRHRVAA
ncbi:hypothetical protein [Xanthocytophaga flavus]|nr:hypothetical protein [Xanthocytophaga flavus]